MRFSHKTQDAIIFYTGYRVNFVFVKEIIIATPSNELGSVSFFVGDSLPSIDVGLTDLDGRPVNFTYTAVHATLFQVDGPQHPVFGQTKVRVENNTASFLGLSVQHANSSLFIRFSYADYFIDSAIFSVVPTDPVGLVLMKQPPHVITSTIKFQIHVALLDQFDNICQISHAKVYAFTCTAGTPGCQSLADVSLFSSISGAETLSACAGRNCSYESLEMATANGRTDFAGGLWYFNHLVVKKAAPEIQIYFGVEQMRTNFPFTAHDWWIPSLESVSDYFECVRGEFSSVEIVSVLGNIGAGDELPVVTFKLTDSEGNNYDPAASESEHGTPFTAGQVGQTYLFHLHLETLDAKLLTSKGVVSMDNSTYLDAFKGNVSHTSGDMSYAVSGLFFNVSGVSIFRAGSYKFRVSINGTDILVRNNQFHIIPAVIDRLVFNTTSGNIQTTLNVTAGTPVSFHFHVLDEFGNYVFNLPDTVSVVATGKLLSRAPWLEIPSSSSWLQGQMEANVLDGSFIFDLLMLPYAGAFTLHFRYAELANSVDLVVTAVDPFQIALTSAPTSFKIDGQNLGSLPGLPYRAAVVDSFNNTIFVQSIKMHLAATSGSEAQLCLPSEDGVCQDRFNVFDIDVDNLWSSHEFDDYSDKMESLYGDYVSGNSFVEVDRNNDGFVSKIEFQRAGLKIVNSAPFFEISDMRIELPAQNYSLIFSSGALTLQTDSFDVIPGNRLVWL